VVHPSRFGQVIAVVALGLFGLCASAQAQNFSTPTNVSNNTDFSMTPQVAADASGKTYVVWEDDPPANPNNSNILFSWSRDGGMTFSPPKNLSNTAGISFNPRICVDSKGAINVVWIDATTGTQDIFFSRSTDSGANFSKPTQLSSEAAFSASPQIGVDGAGNVSVVWESDSAPLGILFRHAADGVMFSTAINLATNPINPNLTASLAPQMAVGVDGSINIVWEDDFNFQSDISFSRSTDQGATFSPTVNLSHNAGNSFGAQIAVDLSGNINVVWMDDTPGNFDILFTRSTDKGATFASVVNVSNSPGDSGSPQVGVDGSGNIFVAWQDNVPPVINKDIYFAVSSNGMMFSNPPQNLSNNSGNSINPSMTVDSTGAVNVGWQDNTPGKANVFFARSIDGGATFTSPAQNVSNDSGASSDVQVTADSKGNLNVAWSDNAPSVNQIFFSRLAAPRTVNQRPVADAGADQLLECTGHGCASATLNGSASSDPDGDPLSYVWTDETGKVVDTTAMARVNVALGTHAFMLTVTDPGGLSSTATTHVTVRDTTPPTLKVSLSPSYLAPPNHKLVEVTAQVQASDVCDAKPTVQLVSITFNGSSDEEGNDVQAVGGGPVAFGTDVRSFLLRAELAHGGVDRVYTATYKTTDASGNTTVASAQVEVGKGSYGSAKRPKRGKGKDNDKDDKGGHDRD